MTTVKIDSWCIVHNQDGYTAPELVTMSLVGHVTGHPRKDDGARVRTSHIVKVNGRIVTTNSGTIYELGEPDQEYVKWCDESGHPFDPEQPFPFKQSERV